MGCDCEVPREHVDPRRKGSCLSCAKLIDLDADWVVNDRTHNAFLDRIEAALRESEHWPEGEPAPPDWRHFRYLAMSREQEGRERYGFAYLQRDNIMAGAEEASDGLNYTYFEMLKMIRNGDDPQMGLVLTAAYHDYMAYRARLLLRSKRLGSPA